MEEDMYVPMFHYGGRFGRDTYGVLSYVDGSVKRWPPLDIDLVSLPVLEDLLKELGYEKYEKLLWHDLSFPDLEFGLHELKGDAGINEMRGAPMTKKERRAAKGVSAAGTSTSKAKKTNTQVDPPAMNDSSKANNKTVDPIAKKNKKKMPLKPGVRVKPPKQTKQISQPDEIPISQNATSAEEHRSASQNLSHNQATDASYSGGIQATIRMKQPIIRPQIRPATTTLGDNVQGLHGNGTIGVSDETMAVTSSGTAARLFKYMHTPGFKPPRQK
ncbi:hypothetical protein PIB30_025082 [Stylosanthes scabra]|uniref:PB1-like domain-containing protein n=1 Tax=Stylosanthes scabra TaxID=79078 RepID=A0ABU6UAE3_9FABA|nr:hypothetical protein [Stylosanthes scabra]